MSSNNRPPKLNFDHPVYTALEEEREPEMLLAGLSLADSAEYKKLKEEKEKPVKRRSLDDMRRLSEHIKNVPAYRRK